jgi:Bacterial SH3 domain
MHARARRLKFAGLAAATAALIAACGSAPPKASPSATGAPTIAATPTPSPTAQIVGTTRTVLSPLGLRIHSAPALGSANVVGNAAQGATVTVLDYQSGGGGWLKVQGRSVTGWIVADPTLTATGAFNRYAAANGVAALYPQTWGFQQESYGAIFLPQQGMQNMLLEPAPALKSFGLPGLPGYTQSTTGPVVVCGYTGTLNEYAKNASYTGATPTALPVPRLALYAEIRLKFDATHAMLIGFNYQTSDQLDVFADLYNSITFPFPLCQATAAPKPTPVR